MGSTTSTEDQNRLQTLEPIQETLLARAREHGFQPQVLDLRDRRGHTDYIDFVTPADMKETPIKFGVDCFRRPFVSLLLQPVDEHDQKQTTPFVITAFQRYTHDLHPWCVGGPEHDLYFDHRALDIVDKCTSLFRGETVKRRGGDESEGSSGIKLAVIPVDEREKF
jgi:hypothetical protein